MKRLLLIFAPLFLSATANQTALTVNIMRRIDEKTSEHLKTVTI